MGFHRTMREDGVIESHLTGRVDAEEIVEHLGAISDLAAEKSAFYEIVVHEFGSFMDLDSDDLDEIMNVSTQQLGKWDVGAIAFVAENDLGNAVCTQIAARVGPELRVPLRVFETKDSAEHWVAQIKEHAAV